MPVSVSGTRAGRPGPASRGSPVWRCRPLRVLLLGASLQGASRHRHPTSCRLGPSWVESRPWHGFLRLGTSPSSIHGRYRPRARSHGPGISSRAWSRHPWCSQSAWVQPRLGPSGERRTCNRLCGRRWLQRASCRSSYRNSGTTRKQFAVEGTTACRGRAGTTSATDLHHHLLARLRRNTKCHHHPHSESRGALNTISTVRYRSRASHHRCAAVPPAPADLFP